MAGDDTTPWLRTLRRRPPAAALAWVERETGGRVVRVRPLRGGLSNAMHLVHVQRGTRTDVLVLRRFVSDWHAPGTAEREATVLSALARHGLPAPRLVAADPDGVVCEAPAVLLTRVEGWRRLPPEPAPAWLDSLAATLYALHALPADGFGDLPDLATDVAERLAGPPPESYADRPADLRLRELLAAVVAEEDAVAPERGRVLVHDDYWGGNTLRRGHRVVAVVDWSSAGLGLRAMDVGYCAMDLALAYGEQAGARFRTGYERLAGPVEQLPLWELVGALRPDPAEWLPSWRQLGLPHLTADLVAARLAGVKERAAAALRAAR